MLRMMVNNLLRFSVRHTADVKVAIAHQEIVFRIFKNHIDRFILQYDFLQCRYIFMTYLPIELMNVVRLCATLARHDEDIRTAISRIAL